LYFSIYYSFKKSCRTCTIQARFSQAIYCVTPVSLRRALLLVRTIHRSVTANFSYLELLLSSHIIFFSYTLLMKMDKNLFLHGLKISRCICTHMYISALIKMFLSWTWNQLFWCVDWKSCATFSRWCTVKVRINGFHRPYSRRRWQEGIDFTHLPFDGTAVTVRCIHKLHKAFSLVPTFAL